MIQPMTSFRVQSDDDLSQKVSKKKKEEAECAGASVAA
jgi:hypothetical protein